MSEARAEIPGEANLPAPPASLPEHPEWRRVWFHSVNPGALPRHPVSVWPIKSRQPVRKWAQTVKSCQTKTRHRKNASEIKMFGGAHSRLQADT